MFLVTIFAWHLILRFEITIFCQTPSYLTKKIKQELAGMFEPICTASTVTGDARIVYKNIFRFISHLQP